MEKKKKFMYLTMFLTIPLALAGSLIFDSAIVGVSVVVAGAIVLIVLNKSMR